MSRNDYTDFEPLPIGPTVPGEGAVRKRRRYVHDHTNTAHDAALARVRVIALLEAMPLGDLVSLADQGGWGGTVGAKARGLLADLERLRESVEL